MLFAADEGILYIPDNDEATTRMMKAKLINEKHHTCWMPSLRACKRDSHINNGI
jgi:hypothetical protein